MTSHFLKFSTSRAKEVIDVTEQVERCVVRSRCRDGVCHLFIQHTTAALAVGESGEGTAEDLLEVAQAMIPKIRFRHAHDPSHAPDHMASTIFGPNLTLPIVSGKLALGTWQRVLLLELNGPRERSIVASILS